MDSGKVERGRGPESDQDPVSHAEPEEPQRTPVRPSRGTKRKLQSPSTTPAGSKTEDLERPGSSKKRRKSTSGQPSAGSLLKPAMTERQQMALLKQMTSAEVQKSPAADPIEETPPRLEVTPKSRLQRRNERGETPLHVACIRGDIGTAVTLIAQGADVNATDHAGWTALHEACNYGYVKLVVLLLKHGAAKNIRGMDGDTPLHDAAVNNHLEVVKTLLEHGADPNMPNDKGHTPMDVCKDAEILRTLKEEKGEGGGVAGGGTEVAMETGALSDTMDQKMPAEKKFSEKVVRDGMESKSERREVMGMESVPASSTKMGTDASNVDQRTESESETLPLSHSESSSLENLPESTKKTATGRPPRGAAKVRGGFYSDISSSESDSDYFELASRKSRRKGKPMHFVRKLEEVREGQEMEEEAEAPKGREEGEDQSEEPQPQVSEGSKEDGQLEGTSEESGKVKSDESTEEKRDADSSVPQPSLTAAAQTGDQSPEEDDGSEKTPTSVARGNQIATATSAEGVPAQQQQLPVDDAPSPTLPGKSPEKEDSDDAEIDVDTMSSTPTTDGEVFPPMPTSPTSSPLESVDLIVSVPLSLVKLSVSKQDTKGAKVDQGVQEERGGLETRMEVDQTPEEAAGSSLAKLKPSKEEAASGLYERLSHGRYDASEADKEEATAVKKDVASDERLSVQDSHLPAGAGSQSKEAAVTPPSTVATAPTEKHARHGRKPQHVFSGKKAFREVKREGEVPSQLECSETLPSLSEKIRDTFGIGCGGPASHSHSAKGSDSKQGAAGTRDGDTRSAVLVGGGGGRGGGDGVQVRRVKEEDMGGQTPMQKSSDSDLDHDDDDDDSNFSKSAIVSLSTSLPIIFSRHAPGIQQQQLQLQQKMPPTTMLITKQQTAPGIPKDVLTTPPNFKPHTLPILLEAMKFTASQKKGSGQSGAGKDTSQETEDIHLHVSLPPKKRYRGVQRSAVVQQRRERWGPPPVLPSQFHSFLMCTRDYQSKRPLQPSSPKSVYPPIHVGLYKLFSEQEGERVKLAVAHLAEQDRLLLSMEQELLRAHQRATKSHTPISVCSVLLERLLPRSSMPLEQVEGSRGERVSDEGKPDVLNPTEKSKGSSPAHSLDERLLSALVQDVWDKFHELQSSLVSRQRHEAEALWLLQRDQWTDRLTDLGLSETTSSQDLPRAHVPLATALTRNLS